MIASLEACECPRPAYCRIVFRPVGTEMNLARHFSAGKLDRAHFKSRRDD
jgi:hypothetical protein